MMRARWVALACAVWVASWAARARAGDPYLEWYTVKTPHFRVHYHGGLEDIAQRTASSAESVYQRLVPQLGWAPKQVTEIVITDDTDSANGSADPCRTTSCACSRPRPTTCRRSPTTTIGSTSSSPTSTRTSCRSTTSRACPRSATPSWARRSRRTKRSRAGSWRAWRW